MADPCHEQGIAALVFYLWRPKCGRLDNSDVQGLKELTAEDARLKRLLAGRDLKVEALMELRAKNWWAWSCGERRSAS